MSYYYYCGSIFQRIIYTHIKILATPEWWLKGLAKILSHLIFLLLYDVVSRRIFQHRADLKIIELEKYYIAAHYRFIVVKSFYL